MTEQEMIRIIEKLIGGIEPTGSSTVDARHLENLKLWSKITDYMLCRIYEIASIESYEWSVQKITDYARDFIKSTADVSEMWRNDIDGYR